MSAVQWTLVGALVAWLFGSFMYLLWPRRCVWARWHHWTQWERLTVQATRYRCSCGRHWAVNHDVGFALPWEEVRHLYDGPFGWRQFPPRDEQRPS